MRTIHIHKDLDESISTSKYSEVSDDEKGDKNLVNRYKNYKKDLEMKMKKIDQYYKKGSGSKSGTPVVQSSGNEAQSAKQVFTFEHISAPKIAEYQKRS